MTGFVVKRIAVGAATVIATSFVSWLVFVGAINPLWSFFPNFKSPDALAAAARGHVHDPLVVRYWFWVKGMFDGHGFGQTIVTQQAIGPIVVPAFLRTLELMALSLVFVVLLSMLVGAVSARRRGTPLDVTLRSSSYLLWSVPAFLLALLLQRAFAGIDDTWHFLPFALQGAPTHGVVDWFQHMTLPALAIAVGLAAVYGRYLRSSLLTELGTQYVGVARAKGLSERRVLRRHALRNALVPFVTMLALDFGALFGATLAVDAVFGLNGMASVFLYTGLLRADPNVIAAELVLTAVLVVAAGILADLVCARLDPRVRLS